jgi:hypothetical protein
VKTDFRKVVQGAVLGSLLVCGLVGLSGCNRGPTGPEGPQGATGAAGVSLLKEYTGSISAAGDFTLSVPEILGRRTTTYVEAYWAIPSAPDIWTPMSDGWTAPGDPALTSRTMSVSWTYGDVYMFGMKANDIYLIRVFQNN